MQLALLWNKQVEKRQMDGKYTEITLNESLHQRVPFLRKL
jgi:hypothetical protein